ncbi:sensor histidine kinase [Inhella gelatinilytica]|uniref:histidine kinase n=1 Tax=Inhella gelatinilytica TaxID=2795030 RepID=A0A931NDV7_9BURK|nr:sensor histidine kinase [Inhella gelatinilytica]MBH9551841.1 sensor histidine kinase N-terminal domain-containing protein [Inhella gelatinilytica]
MSPPPARFSRRGPRSLFGELLDWMLAPLLVLWPTSVVLTWAVAQSIANQPYDRELTETARALAEQAALQEGRLHLNAQTLALLRNDPADTVLYQVLGPKGELVAGDGRLPVPQLGRQAAGQVQLREDELEGESLRVAAVWVRLPVTVPGTPERHLILQLAEGMSRRESLASDIIKGVLLPQFLLLPLAALMAWLALTQGFRPLEALQRRIRSRAADDLSPIDVSQAPEEVAPLVQAINDLLARRERALRTQKQFLADAAHQLKTPLAGLRTQAELAARALQRGESSPEELKRSLDHIAQSSQAAAHTVSQLLALARSESGADVMPREPMDLAALARDTMQDFVPRALNQRIDLGYDGPDHCELRVTGLPWMLVELIRNLVDNALLYTPDGGTVTVRVTEDPFGRVVVLQVEDNGPGIPESTRDRVFEPFYRQLGTGVEGSGLGLAIALQIARQHGTTIELSEARPRRGTEGPGALFTLRFNAE